MKKLMIIALCVGMMSGTVSAQTIETVEGEPVVIVSEKGEGGAGMAFFAVKTGGDINDNNAVIAAGYTTVGENGLAEFKFGMKENSDGVYDLYVKEDGEKIIKYERAFTYAGVTARSELMRQIQSAGVESLMTDENAIALESIGCKYGEMNDNEKDKVEDMLSDVDFTGTTEKEFAILFNTSLSAVKINDAGNVNEVSAHISIANPCYENKFYNDITDSNLSSYLSECIYVNKEYLSSERFINMYRIANILYSINNARVDDIEGILRNNSTILGIESNEAYKNYMSIATKHNANEKIVRTLKQNKVYTISELCTVIKTSVEQKQPSTTGGGGGSSSGGKTESSSSELYLPAIFEKPTTNYFHDIASGHWAYEAVKRLSESGIVSGDENKNFRPDDVITREEFIKMLVTAAGVLDENAECTFSDVVQDAWYYKYIASAVKAGIVHGISEDLFGIGSSLTRQDMMVLAGRSSKNLLKIREYSSFLDENMISDYAKEDVIRLYEAGIASGVGNNEFVPFGNATRAQGAQIIYNIFIK